MQRIIFYWYVLTRYKDELLYKFYYAQKYSPSAGDWMNLELEMNEGEISLMSHYQFKKHDLCKDKTFKRLASSCLKSLKM